jgi:hypothetical protein
MDGGAIVDERAIMDGGAIVDGRVIVDGERDVTK